MDYLFDFNKERNKQITCQKISLIKNLTIENIMEGYLLPAKKEQQNLFGLGGVLSSKMEPVIKSFTVSGAKFTKKTEYKDAEIYFGGKYDVSSNVTKSDEEVVYLGYINNHWGHFLVDFSTRLWAVKKYTNKNVKFVFLVNEGEKFEPSSNIKQFLELCGLTMDRIEFVNKVTNYKKIFLPESSYITNVYYSEEYLQMFSTLVDNCNINSSTLKNEKIYLTRTHFYKAKKTEFGEKQIENLFKQNGFLILSPEKLSLIEQIGLFNNSNLIVCMSGTLGHNLLFSQNDTELVILNKTYNYNIVQRDINQITRKHVTYIDCYLAPFPVSLGFGPFIMDFNENLQKFFIDRKFSSSKKSTDHFKKENVIRYMKRCRIHLNKIGFIYPKDTELNNYYATEHLEYFMENYYLETFPVKKTERVRILLKNLILFITNKI